MQVTFAQTPYLGGEGDGYATASLQFDVVNSINELENKIAVYPTVVRPNQSVSINSSENVQSITLVDLSGKIYLTQVSRNIKLPQSIQSGLYTIIIALEDDVYYSKIIVIDGQ